MAKPGQINVEELSDELRASLGLAKTLDEALVSPRTEALGKVLRALKGLTVKQAVSVLEQAVEQITEIPVYSGEVLEPQPLTINIVLQTVANVFCFSVDELKGRERTADIALARQVAMYVLSMRDEYTLTTIGDALGGRSPSTISHGFQLVAEKLRRNTTLRNKVEEVEAEMRQAQDKKKSRRMLPAAER